MKPLHFITGCALIAIGIVIGALISRLPPASVAPVTDASRNVADAQVTPAAAQPIAPPPPQMHYIEYRYFSDTLTEETAAGQPRKLWRAGPHLARIEKPVNDEGTLYSITVSNAPDSWQWTAPDGEVSHRLDPGPTYNVILPVFQDLHPDVRHQLQFGEEAAFFDRYNAVAADDTRLEGQDVSVRVLERGDYRLTLYSGVGSGLPVQLSLKKGEGMIHVRYLQYEPGLAFDPRLFEAAAESQPTDAQAPVG